MANTQPALRQSPRLNSARWMQRIGWLALLLISACSDTDQASIYNERNQPTNLAAWQLSRAEAATAEVTRLINATRAFLDNPNDASRQSLQQAWQTAHAAWLKAAFLLPDTAEAHNNIDRWPIEPGFLDSLPNYPSSGLVNELMLELDAETLRDQHLITDTSEAALGYHVLEYYAFERPLESFTGTDSTSQRRRQLLTLVAEQLLHDHLEVTRALKREDATADLPASQVDLLVLLNHRSEQLFSEMNREGSHGRYSGTSINSIAAKLETMEGLMDQPPGLKQYLIDLNPAQAESLYMLLAEVREITRDRTTLDESEASRSLLLLSAINHQLEDFVALVR